MITVRKKYLYMGLSTDTKPIGVPTPNGAAFVEIDTGDGYLYDAENETWYVLPQGSVHIDPANGVDF